MDSLVAQTAAAKARHEQVTAPARADEVRIANARIRAAKAQLKQTQVLLARTIMKCSSRGQILKLNVEEGELIGPDTAEPAIVFADTRQCFVRAFVEELDAPRVSPGMTATIVADGLPEHQFTGRICRVSPLMTSKELRTDAASERYDTKVREVCIQVDASIPLVVGLRVEATIDPQLQGSGHSGRSRVVNRQPYQHSPHTARQGPRL